MTDEYEIEIENLKNIMNYENARVLRKGECELTQDMYEHAKFMLSYQKDDKKLESEKQIIQLKADIKIGAQLPAIALEDMRHYFYVADGNHRLIALYESGIRRHKAIFVKRR